MSQRTITLHTFCSVKGGVGKSTLAIVCAKLLARQGRVPALVDADLTGTSIADGLRLCAPDIVVHTDGSVDLDAAPKEKWLSVDDTRRARARRRAAGGKDRVHPPPYFNDILDAMITRWDAGEREAVRVDAIIWRHDRDDRVRYLPSSALPDDIARSLDWYNKRDPFDWAECFMWALEHLSQQIPALTDVIVDLPPGTWGLSHEAMVIASTLLKGEPLQEGLPRWIDGPVRWRANPFLVTSGDGNDLLPALEYLGRNHLENLPELRLLANRATEGLDVIRDRGRRLLGPAFEDVGLEKWVERVPEVGVLARIFKDGDVPPEDVQALSGVLRIEEPT